MTSTTGVDLTIRAELFPEGTVYGGGPTTYRYPDADPVDETPTPATVGALAELGSTGEAIRWAMRRGLLTETDDSAQRVTSDGDPGEPVDRYVFEGTMTLDEWREFAGIYLVSIDDETAEPDHAEPIDVDQPARTDLPDGSVLLTRSWRDWSDSMDWNVGGLSKVNGAEVDIVMWELTTPVLDVDQETGDILDENGVAHGNIHEG